MGRAGQSQEAFEKVGVDHASARLSRSDIFIIVRQSTKSVCVSSVSPHVSVIRLPILEVACTNGKIYKWTEIQKNV